MHHIPTYELRLRLLIELIEHTQQNGLIAVSFWQFMEDDKFAAKTEEAHKKALEDLSQRDINLERELEENDYLLGWKDEMHTYRYCHHFTDEEINNLTRDISDKAELIETYKADGKTHCMNRYILLRKRGA